MKMKTKNVGSENYVSIVLIIVICAVFAMGLTYFFATQYLHDRSESQKSSTVVNDGTLVNPSPKTACENNEGTNYTVRIENDQMIPQRTEAKICDSLTFINNDPFRLLTFGVHEKHITYNGVTEKPLKTGDSFTIELAAVGTIPFHDHNQEEVAGVFIVKEN